MSLAVVEPPPCLRAVHPPPRPCPPSTQPFSISSSFLLYFVFCILYFVFCIVDLYFVFEFVFVHASSTQLHLLSTHPQICSFDVTAESYFQSPHFEKDLVKFTFFYSFNLCTSFLFIGPRYTWGPIYGSECL